MASPVLALSRFANFDQEFAPESPNPLVGSTADNGAYRADVQPLPVEIPEDTVTLSTTEPQRKPYPIAAATTATADASYAPTRSKENASSVSNARDADRSQSSANTSANLTTSSSPKAPPKPEPAPREFEASHDDPYQATIETTQQSLLQLDRTLQQIGVDPQHTSLVRRVALVRLANDPPALGEYFGPPSSVAASITNSSPQAAASAPELADSKTTSDTPTTSSDVRRRSFAPQGKLLNVSA